MVWLTENGANVFRPVFRSPDIDLVAELNGNLFGVDVKTCGSLAAKGTVNRIGAR